MLTASSHPDVLRRRARGRGRMNSALGAEERKGWKPQDSRLGGGKIASATFVARVVRGPITRVPVALVRDPPGPLQRDLHLNICTLSHPSLFSSLFCCRSLVGRRGQQEGRLGKLPVCMWGLSVQLRLEQDPLGLQGCGWVGCRQTNLPSGAFRWKNLFKVQKHN